MRLFKYDIMELIKSVQERPCLWDKKLETYKDRAERRMAWEEIFRILDASYETLCEGEKRLAGEHILDKWTNVRDTFLKSLKTKMGKPKKKYMYHEQLKFLIDVAQIPNDTEQQSLNCTEEPPEEPLQIKLEKDDITKHSRRKRTKKVEYIEESKKSRDSEKTDVDFVEIDEYNDPRVMNEDEAFFASLLPSVVNYSEDERLEFRIEVLSVMKRIKDKRKWSDVNV